MKTQEIRGLNLYNSFSNYYNDELSFWTPCVSYVKDEDKVYIRPTCSVKIVYNIAESEINKEKYLFYSSHKAKSCFVDGKEVKLSNTKTEAVYTFTTSGRHIAYLTFDLNAINAYDSFTLCEYGTVEYHNITMVMFENMGTKQIYPSDAGFLISGKVETLDLWDFPMMSNGGDGNLWLGELPNLQKLILPKCDLSGITSIFNIPKSCVIYLYKSCRLNMNLLNGYTYYFLDDNKTLDV